MAKEPYVFNLKKPEDSPQEIANKLNTLKSSVDVTVINGAVSQKDFEAYKEVNDGLVKGYEDRVNYNIQEGRKKLGDLRYHGAGLSEVIHDATLTGKGTVDSPLKAIGTGTGSVVSFSLVQTNGFGGSVASSTTTPALTLTVTVSSGSMLKSNGTALVAAVADVDYLTPNTASSTYLTQGQATARYLSISSATALYLSQSSATATYLPYSVATSIYLSQALATSQYLSQALGTATYLSQAAATGTYLSISLASANFAPLYSSTDIDILGMQGLGSTVKAQALGVTLGLINGAASINNQQSKFVSIYVPYVQSIQGVKWYQHVQGNFTGNNFNGLALYSYSAGTMTQVAITANDPNIWKGVSQTFASAAFTAPYVAPVGTYYIGMLYCESAQTAAPQLGDYGTTVISVGVAGMDFTNSAKVQFILSTQTTLPSSISLTAATGSTTYHWLGLF